MRILQLCNKIPYPPLDGGAIAMLNLSTALAELGHQLTVLAMNTPKHYYPVNNIPDAIKTKMRIQYIDVNTAIRPISLIRNLFFSNEPYNAIRFQSKDFSSALQQLLIEQDFDVIQLEGLYLQSYIPLLQKLQPKALLVYRAHNIEGEIWQNLKTNAPNPFKRLYLSILARRIRQYENAMINSYDLLVPISDTDSEELSRMGNTRPLQLCPTGFPGHAFMPPQLTSAIDLFFIGALDWQPNIKGLQWFIQSVWKQLRISFPELQFHIAGRNAPVGFAKTCIQAGIHFHGEVPSATDFMDQHHIMVVPLFAGSGLRIKIIEAMARGKAIVTTNKGVQGIPATHNKHLLLANNPKNTYEEIKHLINQPETCHQIQQNAYTFAHSNYSSTEIAKQLSVFYQKHLA